MIETRAARRGTWQADVVTVVTLFCVLLIVLPARLVVPGLGGAGRPAVIVGVLAAGWWLIERIMPAPEGQIRSSNIARQVLWLYLFVFAIAYAMGYARGLPGDEASAADRALIVTAAMAGVALLVLDGVTDRKRLDVLLQRLTVAGAVMAAVGIVQFATGFDLAAKIRVPGLVLNRDLYGISQRGGPGFNRVTGTAGHPIEFGVVAAMLVPFGIHYAMYARSSVERQWRWIVVALLALAVPFSISRSGTIALVVALVTMIIVWARPLRRKALAVILVSTVLLRAAIPGLLGTIRSLFKNASTDPSITGRTSDYDNAFSYIAQRPIFGRGPRTFLPSKYIVLDNQYLNTAITMGYVGLAAFVLLFVGAFMAGRQVYRRAGNEETRHLGQAFAAAFLAAALTSFTFDSLAFAMFHGVLLLLLGCVGALLSLPTTWATAPDSDDGGILRRPRGGVRS
jgi:O-antigen ligase